MVAFAVGIAAYFTAPFVPNIIWPITFAMLTFGVARYVVDWRSENIRAMLLLLCFAAMGFARGDWHTKSLSTPFLSEGVYEVTGWIEAIERSGAGLRWRVNVSEIKGRFVPDGVTHIRVKVHDADFEGGAGVKLRAVLSEPPPPAIHGGYDPARRSFYDGVSAYGFVITEPTLAQVEATSLIARQNRRLTRLRYEIVERILAGAPDETAGLQAALMTGVRTYIPEEQTVALRIAGLAHVLAISGLHMGLLAGSVYWVFTLGLACIIPLSRRYDVRKPAAVIGMFSAVLYLTLSGASVATQRAFIMTMIVFFGVLLNRRAISIRSVSIAAFITLSLHPESLLSVGFHMSFSAVIALVVVYQHWRGPSAYRQRMVRRMAAGFTTLSITSFVAGSATAVFAVLQFGRIARYSFLGNILAMPIFTAIVMPAALVSFVALPFGLEAYPLWVMGKALSVMIFISEHIAALPGSIDLFKSPPTWMAACFGLAFVWVFIGKKTTRIAGVLAIAFCCVAWAFYPVADMRVSEVGKVAFWSNGKFNTLYVDTKRSDRFGREQFRESAGTSKPNLETYKTNFAECDELACRFTLKNYDVSVIQHPSEVLAECAVSDIVILAKRQAGPVARRRCDAILIDERTLSTFGALSVYLSSKDVKIRSANTAKRQRRPWG